MYIVHCTDDKLFFLIIIYVYVIRTKFLEVELSKYFPSDQPQ